MEAKTYDRAEIWLFAKYSKCYQIDQYIHHLISVRLVVNDQRRPIEWLLGS